MKRVNFDNYYKLKLNKFFFRWVDIKKIRILKKELSKYDNIDIILDLGSGTGEIASKLKKNIICIDKNDNLLSLCRKKGLKAKKVDLDKKLPFKDSSISVVIMIDVIEHVRDPSKLLKEINRIVKKGGKIIIFTPSYDSIRWLLAEKIHHLFIRKASDHISPFTKESLTFLLEENFKQFKIKRINFNLTLCAIITLS